jgi:hypothetical protein
VHRETDAKLQALHSSTARVRDMLLEQADRPSSLAAPLSSIVELFESRIDAAAGNGGCWGTQSALAATLSHFLELGAELELLGSRCNADLTEDQTNALLT